MADTKLEIGRAKRPENGVEEQRRLAKEADARDPGGVARRRTLTLQGLSDVDAGHLIDDNVMRAWADSLGTDHELPAPLPD